MSVSGQWQMTTVLSAVVVTGVIGWVGGSGRFAASVHAQDAPAVSVRDGVYTEEQAARGAALYEKQCGPCHGEMLEGGIAPGLTGEEFVKYWDTKTLDEMVEKMRMDMPPDDPGKLTPAQVSELTALILSKNKFPAGQRELGTELAALKQIRFVKPT